MPYRESLASMRLFAKEVLPVFHSMPTPMMIEEMDDSELVPTK